MGASALMQGLADGYFVLPYTIGNYLAPLLGEAPLAENDAACGEVVSEVADRTQKWLSINGTREASIGSIVSSASLSGIT